VLDIAEVLQRGRMLPLATQGVAPVTTEAGTGE